METKTRNIIVAVAVISILGIGSLVILNPGIFGPSTTLHYESNLRITGYGHALHLFISGIQDCEFSLSFEDNEDLLYRIDVELWDTTEVLYFTHYTHTWDPQVHINGENNWGHTTRVKTMSVVLGTGLSHNLQLGSYSSNVTGVVTYGNNVTVGEYAEFAYWFPGSLHFEFTENVTVTTGYFEIFMGDRDDRNSMSSVVLDIDLPDGMDGIADFKADSIGVSGSGWTMTSSTISPRSETYRTADTSASSIFEIEYVYASSLVAILNS
ncbi:MAG: hypothetical protein ACW99G_22575 [Candidatus Thorarchaeota archaeon]